MRFYAVYCPPTNALSKHKQRHPLPPFIATDLDLVNAVFQTLLLAFHFFPFRFFKNLPVVYTAFEQNKLIS